MRAHRYVGVTILSAFVLAGLWPGSLLAQSTSADRSIGLVQRQVTRKPYDATAYHRLGDAYIHKARESGDVTYFDLAERALGKALELAPRYGDAARHLAFVLYSRHDFDGAAREAQRAVDLNPTDAHALGVLGDAYLEVGKYEAARETYGTMTRRSEEHTSELQSQSNLVCRLLLEKKNKDSEYSFPTHAQRGLHQRQA